MEYMKTIIGILVIVNPIGIAPVFLGLTEEYSKAERKIIARITTTTSTLLLIGSALFGQYILAFFGVSIPAFRVAGGILILLIAISMLNAKRPRSKFTPGEEIEAAERESIAIVPISIPLLCGPGAISTTIVYGSHAQGMMDYLFLILACAFVGVCIYTSLRLSNTIGNVLGKTGVNIVTRLFGILLAAIGVEFIIGGLTTMLPFLNK